METKLTPNTLAFIALSNEYCEAIEKAVEMESSDLIRSMLRLLPRIYISATDLQSSSMLDETGYIDDALDEEAYDQARRNLEMILGEDDTYLEVFEEDMKYSDTPIAASISEGLCDIFQVLFNFLEAIKDTTDETINAAISIVIEDFRQYWSQRLCNVLRALNHIKYQQD